MRRISWALILAACGSANEDRFATWLDTHAVATDAPVAEMAYAYFDTSAPGGRAHFLSPPVTADVIRFRLQRGEIARAAAAGLSLVAWQHATGAFPSEIERAADGSYAPSSLFDSADTLQIIEALLALDAATGDGRFLAAAARAGAWLRDTMCHGERIGMWVEPLGAPMKAMTVAPDGTVAYDNRIAVGRTWFWIGALGRLGARLHDASFSRAEADARAFLAVGRAGTGGFYDHYDPGWPAAPYSLSRFHAAGIDGSVYADDSLRAALAALRGGDRAAAEAFARRLTVERGGVYGYVALDGGGPRFVAGDAPYFDVISTALLRTLLAELGRPTDSLDAFLAGTQDGDGGWHWGRVAADGRAVDADQATLTGLWAVADLTPAS